MLSSKADNQSRTVFLSPTLSCWSPCFASRWVGRISHHFSWPPPTALSFLQFTTKCHGKAPNIPIFVKYDSVLQIISARLRCLALRPQAKLNTAQLEHHGNVTQRSRRRLHYECRSDAKRSWPQKCHCELGLSKRRRFSLRNFQMFIFFAQLFLRKWL